MALCSLCSAIPLDSLPPHHPTEGYMRTFDEDDLPVIVCRHEYKHDSEHPIGYPWHPDLDSLVASAPACALCSVVYQGFQNWLSIFERGKGKKFFTEFRDTYTDDVPNGERLWLTQRYGGGPGFNVLVKHQKPRKIYLLTGVAFSVDESNSSAQIIQQRPQDSDSGSDHSLAVAKSMLDRCQDQHKGCHGGEALLPYRILDLGQQDELIRLVEPLGEHGTYACLSYCWGGPGRYTTTRETMEANGAGINVAELPQTLRDAVKAVRSLGIRYLWIDSLCICQDDREEWARESSRMSEIYSNAKVVLAANHAANNSVGLFHERPPRPSCRVDFPGYAQDVHVQMLYNSDEVDWNASGFSSEPLATRSWALQERVLARRLLHYNSRQMYYECDNGIVGEDGCGSSRRFGNLHGLREEQVKQDEKQDDEEESPTDYHALWKMLIWFYGQRNLTHVTDMFPALSGLAKLFAAKIGADYVAGIWSNELIEGICWQGVGDRRPSSSDQYIAPSWSWASYAGIAGLGPTSGRYAHIGKVLDWHIDLKSEANPFGEVVGGWIQIHAPMVPLTQATDLNKDDLEHSARFEKTGHVPIRYVRTPWTKEADSRSYHHISLDNDENAKAGTWESLEMKVMIVASIETDDPRMSGVDGTCFGLIVTNAEGQDNNQVKRLGWIHLDSEEVEEIKADQANWCTTKLV